jgi:phosphoenolpyruvate carboxykinase (GTP)
MDIPGYVTSVKLRAWVEEMGALCRPDRVHWCDGSQAEYDTLCELMVESGTFVRLNGEKRPNSFLAHSDPGDKAPGRYPDSPSRQARARTADRLH